MGKKSGKKNQKKPAVAAAPTLCLSNCTIEGCACDGGGFLAKCSKCSECVGGLKHLLMFITRREEDGKIFTVIARGGHGAFDEFNVCGFPCITLSVDDRENDLLRVKGIWEQLKAGTDGDKTGEDNIMYVDI
jgi:hypothetical protein